MMENILQRINDIAIAGSKSKSLGIKTKALNNIVTLFQKSKTSTWTNVDRRFYHNRKIEFVCNGKKMSGVVLDIIPVKEKDYPTQCIFVPVKKLERFEKEIKNNRGLKTYLKSGKIIDACDIRDAKCID